MSTEFHGVVFVKDGNKAPEDYGVNREVNITIEFNAENQAQLDTLLDAAADKANEKVNELLGRKPDKSSQKANKRVIAEPASAKSGVKTKADIEREAGLTPGVDAHIKPQPAPKVAASFDDLDDVQIVSTAKPADDLDDILGAEEAAPVITDEELLSKITHTNGRTKNAVGIRAVVDKFVPGTDRKYQAREIAQDRRADFLKALEAVPKLITAGA